MSFEKWTLDPVVARRYKEWFNKPLDTRLFDAYCRAVDYEVAIRNMVPTDTYERDSFVRKFPVRAGNGWTPWPPEQP